jgi:lysophospholipase L1-like esterase
LLGIPRLLSVAERDALLAWLVANPPSPALPSDVNLLVVSGDSIGWGYGVPSYQCWAYRMLPLLESIGPRLRLLNLGIPASNLDQETTAYNSTIAPLVSPQRQRQVMINQGGTNSIAFGADSAATVLAKYYALCDSARAAGYKVVACTVLPRSDGGIRGTFEADRATFNADVLANWASHADALANFAGIAGLGAAGDSNGANYQADHVHPNVLGHALAATVSQTSVIPLLS